MIRGLSRTPAVVPPPLDVGHVISYNTRRKAFPQTSGSGHPSFKDRPCVITRIQGDRVWVAPMCGAERMYQQNMNRYVKPQNMDPDWWHPVQFIPPHQGIHYPPSPPDNCRHPRPALSVFRGTNVQIFHNPKPCYLWVGDYGEQISLQEARSRPREYALVATPYTIEALKALPDQWFNVRGVWPRPD